MLLVVNVTTEELDQLFSFLILILDEPGCRPLPEELHQAALHLEPDVAGQIEEKGEECEIEGNPLVVRVVDNVLKHLVLARKQFDTLL